MRQLCTTVKDVFNNSRNLGCLSLSIWGDDEKGKNVSQLTRLLTKDLLINLQTAEVFYKTH